MSAGRGRLPGVENNRRAHKTGRGWSSTPRQAATSQRTNRSKKMFHSRARLVVALALGALAVAPAAASAQKIEGQYIVVGARGIQDRRRPGQAHDRDSGRHGRASVLERAEGLRGRTRPAGGRGAAPGPRRGLRRPGSSASTSKRARRGAWIASTSATCRSTTPTATPRGRGRDAYIIDSGIQTAHADFGGRAVSGFDAVDGGTADDCNGHGTHVAGTVGGATYGVAKGASWSPCGCSTARATARRASASPAWTGSPRTIRPASRRSPT